MTLNYDPSNSLKNKLKAIRLIGKYKPASVSEIKAEMLKEAAWWQRVIGIQDIDGIPVGQWIEEFLDDNA